MRENKITDLKINGRVYLIGAGPGDPELITLKGKKALESADVVVYDRLANPELLAFTSPDSEHIFVGKKPGAPSVSQNRINEILISKALEGKTIARLKGGDPFIFGRGGEECEALAAKKISYEVIPGISSILAAPAYAGIPLTHRNMGRSFTVVTGHTLTGTYDFENWEHLSRADTLVILMGMRNLQKITDLLLRFGMPNGTPVTIIERATYNDQKTVTGTLSTIGEKAEKMSSPATIVVGELASMSNDLGWFENHHMHIEDTTNLEHLSKFAG